GCLRNRSANDLKLVPSRAHRASYAPNSRAGTIARLSASAEATAASENRSLMDSQVPCISIQYSYTPFVRPCASVPRSVWAPRRSSPTEYPVDNQYNPPVYFGFQHLATNITRYGILYH